MGAPELTRFLSALAIEGKVAASTRNDALSALLFLYREVLGLRASRTSRATSLPPRSSPGSPERQRLAKPVSQPAAHDIANDGPGRRQRERASDALTVGCGDQL